MTPQDFFFVFVLGNFGEYIQNPEDIRRAFNAAVSASHMADHYFNYNKKFNPGKFTFKNIGEFVEDITKKTNGCFRDIRSISNSYKHLYEDPSTAKYSTISSTGAIESVSFTIKNSEVKVIGVEWLGDSKPNEVKSKVVFTRKDGKRVDFLPTLKTVINFWESYNE